MADSQNPEVLNALVRLMANLDDPSVLSDDELVKAAIDAREAKKIAEVTVATELSRRPGWTWRRIGAALGVNYTTAYGWVNPSSAKSSGPDATPPEPS